MSNTLSDALRERILKELKANKKAQFASIDTEMLERYAVDILEGVMVNIEPYLTSMGPHSLKVHARSVCSAVKLSNDTADAIVAELLAWPK